MTLQNAIIVWTVAITLAVTAVTVALAAIGYYVLGGTPLNFEKVMALAMIVAPMITPFVVVPLLHKAFKLRRLVRRLDRMANTDELTGLPNRRAFFRSATGSFAVTDRDDIPLAAVMVDIDGFKHLNDTYGHRTGDTVLVQLAQRIATILTEQAGSNAHIGRLGGDELAIILEGYGPDESRRLACTLCTIARRTPFRIGTESITVTLSIGVAPDVRGLSIDAALAIADDAVYEAKARGRDGWAVCCAGAALYQEQKQDRSEAEVAAEPTPAEVA